MSELPVGWSAVPLGELAALKTGPFGSSLHKSDYTVGGLPIVNPMHIVNGKINPTRNMTITPETVERLSEFQLRAGDVVIGRRGEMGRCAVVQPSQVGWLCGTGSLIVRATPAVNPTYLQRFLSSPETVARLEDASVGSTMVNLNQRVLLGLTVPVAPLAEQKLIADKLNALLTRVDACRERLERVPLILKSFRQAVLTAAMSGELTEDRHINEQPAATENGLLGDYCDVLGGKRLPKGFELTDEPTEYPYVRVTDFDNFSIKEGRIKFVPAGAYPKISRYIITENDIYISIAGTIGLVGQVPPSLSGANLTENAARIIVRRGFVPRYLMYQLASPVLQEQMRRKKIATTQEKFGLFRIKSLEVTRPSLEEQLEIVRLIETLFAYADRLEERYKAVQACIEQLKPALLAKAFRGELVPQDPKDEPASVLLERIRASRVTAEGAEEITRAKRRTNLVKKPKARIIMLKRKDVEPSHLSAILKADGPLSAEALWSASQLDIDDFYDQLKDEEAGGLLKENVGEQRLLEAA